MRDDDYDPAWGGPAFPSDTYDAQDRRNGQHWGMTLRDYFAAKAMEHVCCDRYCGNDDECLAFDAYRVADAMLKARAGLIDPREIAAKLAAAVDAAKARQAEFRKSLP